MISTAKIPHPNLRDTWYPDPTDCLQILFVSRVYIRVQQRLPHVLSQLCDHGDKACKNPWLFCVRLTDWITSMSLLSACRLHRDRQKPVNGTQCPTLTIDSKKSYRHDHINMITHGTAFGNYSWALCPRSRLPSLPIYSLHMLNGDINPFMPRYRKSRSKNRSF